MLNRRPSEEGLRLCLLEAKLFSSSLSYFSGSSEIFMRRFAHSALADSFDSESLLNENASSLKCLSLLKEECGEISYGKEKYSQDEMYWIGYIHRFFCLTYQISSLEAFKILKPKELRKVFPPYHSLDCASAIERMLEERGVSKNEREEKVKAIYRKLLQEEKENKRALGASPKRK